MHIGVLLFMTNLKGFKRFLGIIILLVVVFNFHVKAFAQFETVAGSAILMEASTGKFSMKNADVPFHQLVLQKS